VKNTKNTIIGLHTLIVAGCLLCSSASANLLVNGGNDDALVGTEITGWTGVVGDTWTQRSESPSPQDGAAYFNPGAGASHELAQIVDVSAYATDIDAGTQQFDFSGFVSGWSKNGTSNSDADTAQIILEFESASGGVLGTWESVTDSYNYWNDGWVQLTHSQLAPINTRKIEVRLLAVRNDGTNNDGYFDSLELTTTRASGSIIQFNGMSGSNNGDIPAGFGSNLSSNTPGATVTDGGTPGIALTWAGGGAWDLHGSGNAYWAALDADGPSGSTPTVAQMEDGNLPVYIDFTVADGSQLILNSVDLGMATDKTDTYNVTLTIAEVGGAVVATYTPPAMDGDGSSGVMAQTVDLSFTGDAGVDYRLQFEDAPDTNGGAIDNLSFSEIVGTDTISPSLSASDSLNPAGNSTNVSLTADFVATFDENIAAGTGNIVIRRLDDGSVVETIDVTGGQVVIAGAQATITPAEALEELTEYYIEIDAGAFVDQSGNAFAGISGADGWYFTTTEGLRLHIAANGSDLDFWWRGAPNKVYDLLSTTNLLLPQDSWPVYDPDGNDPFSDIAFGGTITILPAVPVADSSRLFALAEKDASLFVIAHRGDSVNAPENTIASITSIAGTADVTEFDAQVTSDGVLVLMHDNTIDRTTDGTGTVASMTLDQIQTLDAGSWFSPEFAGEQVPTLAAAINAAIANGIEPLIERKKGDAADYHSEFVEQALSANDFRVISFDETFLNALDALNPDYRLGWLGRDSITQALLDEAKANGADFLSWNHEVIDQVAVDLVNANGMELMVWTINDADRMQELIDLGVRGITTDDPALLRSLLP
jgi:glycerophosphoryl diester phosphodiesterase